MPNLVVIGGSAGSIEPLKQLVTDVPRDLDAALLVVIHTMPTAPSVLPQILAKASGWPTMHALNGTEIRAGVMYVAPPDNHMRVLGAKLQVTRGPRENGHRPAIDPLFRSAAEAEGKTVAILLSGMGADGSAGLLAVQKLGGTAIVQDPEEALFPTMVNKAIEQLQPDYVLPVSDMWPAVTQALIRKSLPLEEPMILPPEGPNIDIEKSGRQPSPYSCPECGGVLWEEHDKQLFGYRCRVGHAYSYDALLDEQTQVIEKALWAGLRALEEKQSLLERLAQRSRDSGLDRSAQKFLDAAHELNQPSSTFRQLLGQNALYQLPERDDSEPL
jgi:two-component system chemotaxis response regulator CheB